MKGIQLLNVAKALLQLGLASHVAHASPFQPREFASVRRDASTLESSYDYIIIGGGTSGLTVANRLTEDPKSEYNYRFIGKSKN